MYPRRLYLDLAGTPSSLGEVLLVVFLSAVERRRGCHLRHDLLSESTGILQFLQRATRRRLLLRSVGKDRRAVLAPDVPALAVSRRRIVVAPEDIQQLLVRDFRRVEH